MESTYSVFYYTCTYHYGRDGSTYDLCDGDLNHTVSGNEVWGSRARCGPLVDLFNKITSCAHMIDVIPSPFFPTWSDGRTRGFEVSKNLDRVYVYESLM